MIFCSSSAFIYYYFQETPIRRISVDSSNIIIVMIPSVRHLFFCVFCHSSIEPCKAVPRRKNRSKRKCEYEQGHQLSSSTQLHQRQVLLNSYHPKTALKLVDIESLTFICVDVQVRNSTEHDGNCMNIHGNKTALWPGGFEYSRASSNARSGGPPDNS